MDKTTKDFIDDYNAKYYPKLTISKLQMHLEIMEGLTYFTVNFHYEALKGFYGSAEALHTKLGELFEMKYLDAKAVLLNVIEQTNAKGYKPTDPITIKLKDLNARIAETFPELYLVPGHDDKGNFMQLTSDHEALAADIARLPVSRIYVKAITDLTPEQWLMAIQELIDLEPRG